VLTEDRDVSEPTDRNRAQIRGGSVPSAWPALHQVGPDRLVPAERHAGLGRRVY
jgi:hypothetical protein